MVVDEPANLKGLITVKDIKKAHEYPSACKDELGRLRVGAGGRRHRRPRGTLRGSHRCARWTCFCLD